MNTAEKEPLVSETILRAYQELSLAENHMKQAAEEFNTLGGDGHKAEAIVLRCYASYCHALRLELQIEQMERREQVV